jgi:diguanylate cyclase (GGDEF)-like protein
MSLMHLQVVSFLPAQDLASEAPMWKLFAGLVAFLALAVFVVLRRKLSERRDRNQEAAFNAYSARESARIEFDQELKDAVNRAKPEDLSFIVLRKLMARVRKAIPLQSCAALVRFPEDENESVVSADPKSQAEFDAIVTAHRQALKNVSYSGSAVTLTLRAEVGSWTAQTLAILPIPIPKPGFGFLLVSRPSGATFSPSEFDEAADYAQRAIDSMSLARAEAEEKSDREIDKLTQIYNRPALELRAANFFTDAVKVRSNFSIVWIELDKFRVFAKDFGQEKSDLALKTIAQRIARAADRGHVVGRFDNHEFLVILPSVPEFQSQKLADSLVNIIAREITNPNGDAPLTLTASIGFASKFPSDTHFTKVMERAAKGKDQAKYQGGNTARRGNEDGGGVNLQQLY